MLALDAALGWSQLSAAVAFGAAGVAWLVALLTRFSRGSSVAVCAVLVLQATLLASLFQGSVWQGEINFYFVLVIAMSAIFLDTPLLIATTVLVSLVHFGCNAVFPGVLFPEGLNIGRGILHSVLSLFECLCLVLVAWSVRLAVASDVAASDAISGLERSGDALSLELSETSRRADRLDLALSSFSAETSRRLDRLQRASIDLSGTADDFLKAAARTNQRSVSAAEAATGVNRQVQEVAASSDDFRRMIAEIGDYAAQSRRIGVEALDRAMATSSTIDEFTTMSAKIDSILKLIAGIAAHTNLLALNATIEAARAGEQGRGFAIVANEVKALAHQTTAAVADVNQVVHLIKDSTSRSVMAIAAVATSIENLNAAAGIIAHAVDDRIRAATTMADGITLAARNVGDVTSAIGDIRAVADETGQGASFLLTAAQDIAAETDAIRCDVQAFKTDLAAA